MKKVIKWFKDHRPTKRKLIQVYAALLFNANLKGFITGKIYKGPIKNICTPGLNCYSCPGASGACPLGALQNSLSSSNKTAPYYMFGIIMLYGLLFGRWICGFLCPFGLIQELLHKIPTPKLKKSKVTRILSFFKYVVLVFFVIILPIAYAFRNFPLPAFCKYICPAGTLEGAMGLLSNSVNEGFLRMLGPLFTWKFLLMVSFLVACVFIFRFFCRFLCPLGLLYGFFNKIALVGVKLDKDACTECGLCIGKCKMDIKHVGDTECINCGECIGVCPTKAISWKGSKLFLAPNAVEPLPADASEEEKNAAQAANEARNAKIKKRNNIIRITAGVLMVALLGGALFYYNFIDERPTEPPVETPTDTADPSGNDTSNTDNQLPPIGTSVGNTCPQITNLDIFGSDESFDLHSMRGKVVVLNFWFTTCGPCLEELPYFYDAANQYADTVDIVAIHANIPGTDVMSFIENDSGHPEWSDGSLMIAWDTDMYCQNLFQVSAFPTTVVIDADGVITDIFSGPLTKAELTSAIDKALNN